MKKYTWVLITVIFSICFVGCGKKKIEETKTLTLCVEESLTDSARELLDLWETLNENVQGKLEVIPQDSDAAEIKISNIRTELMSGEGPDVFLLSTNTTRRMEGYLCLFPNLEKTIYTDTFLPLDTFLEESKHVNTETWNKKILEAGKTEQGQMILPLSYSYYKYAFPKTEVDKSSIPNSWDALMTCENPMIQKEMMPISFNFYSLFGKLADYKEGKLLFSKEEFHKQMEETKNHLQTLYEKELPASNSQGVISSWSSSFYTSLETSQEDMILAGVPNIEGGITAGVDWYTAINKNSQMKEDAFSLLDLMLRDEILSGQGIMVEKKVMVDSLLGSNDIDQMISDTYLSIKYPQLSDAAKSSLKELNQKINVVTLYSDLEWELSHLYSSYMRSRDETERKGLVSTAYDTMEMSIME